MIDYFAFITSLLTLSPALLFRQIKKSWPRTHPSAKYVNGEVEIKCHPVYNLNHLNTAKYMPALLFRRIFHSSFFYPFSLLYLSVCYPFTILLQSHPLSILLLSFLGFQLREILCLRIYVRKFTQKLEPGSLCTDNSEYQFWASLAADNSAFVLTPKSADKSDIYSLLLKILCDRSTTNQETDRQIWIFFLWWQVNK